MTTPILEIDNLICGYDGQAVIKDISMSLQRGSVVGLVGPNGHGKTTLLRAISGLIKLSSGSIRFKGEPVHRMDANQIVRKGIVHIPQGDLVFSEMTIEENLLMGAYLPDAHAKRKERLNYVHGLFPKLKERATQIASGLSGGERRMLGVGRALMSTSELLLIDEPSLGLAPIIIDHIYEVIKALKTEGRTLLVVEENASRLVDIAEKIYLLDDGHIIWDGQGDDLLNDEVLMSTYLGG
jgi:branched-chain amino acid transport system ATP-binding protein